MPPSHFYDSMCQKTCQHAKGKQIIQLDVPKCQRYAYFSTIFQKNFSSFDFFNYANFKNIGAIFENLSCKTNNLNFNIYKISLKKNLINLKPLISFSMESIGLPTNCKMVSVK